MSFYPAGQALPRRFRLILSSFMQHDGLPFADVLPEQTIQHAFADAEADFAQDDDAIYTPALTLWAFLSQVLHARELRSCTAAVARVIVLLVALGKEPCSDNTGAYCRARAKLPAAIIRRLTTDVADGCERRLKRRWLWKGLHVHLVDGTTVSMPDTVANQTAYPQADSQAEGLGFPIARVVVLLSLATAMVQGMAMGPYAGKETGETALLRELLDRLDKGSVVLADRYYCSYFMIPCCRNWGSTSLPACTSVATWIFSVASGSAAGTTSSPGPSHSDRIGWTRPPTNGCRRRCAFVKSMCRCTNPASGLSR